MRGVMVTIAALCALSVSGVAEQPAASLPFEPLSRCAATPNYTKTGIASNWDGGSSSFIRWRSFPVTYAVDLSAVPTDLRDLYSEAAVRARDLWSNATKTSIGVLQPVTDDTAQITVKFIHEEAVNASGESAGKFPGFTAVVSSGDVIRRATIEVTRFTRDHGLIQRFGRNRVLLPTVNVIAHEIGHALGVRIHSPDPADLMYERGNFIPGRDDRKQPSKFVTRADANTLLEAYCR